MEIKVTTHISEIEVRIPKSQLGLEENVGKNIKIKSLGFELYFFSRSKLELWEKSQNTQVLVKFQRSTQNSEKQQSKILRPLSKYQDQRQNFKKNTKTMKVQNF